MREHTSYLSPVAFVCLGSWRAGASTPSKLTTATHRDTLKTKHGRDNNTATPENTAIYGKTTTKPDLLDFFFSFWNIVWYVEGIAGRTSLTYVLYDAYANIASHAYQILGTNTIIERLFSILHLSH